MTLHAKGNNWGVELGDYNIKYKLNWTVRNTFTDTLSILVELELMESNPSEMEGHEYGYVFGWLSHIIEFI